MINTLTAKELTTPALTAQTSPVAMPRVATPWATPVCPPLGIALRDRSALSSMHSITARDSYVAGGSTASGSTNGAAGFGTAVAKQDRPPRGVPR